MAESATNDDATHLSADTPSTNACQNCGTHVSRDFRRTFGDEDHVAHRCAACDSQFRIAKGSAAGLDVDHPDPAEQEFRDRGKRLEARPDSGRGWESYAPEQTTEKRTITESD